jgi:hypothetical protein
MTFGLGGCDLFGLSVDTRIPRIVKSFIHSVMKKLSKASGLQSGKEKLS